MSGLLSLFEVLGWTWMAWSCWGTPAPRDTEGTKGPAVRRRENIAPTVVWCRVWLAEAGWVEEPALPAEHLKKLKSTLLHDQFGVGSAMDWGGPSHANRSYPDETLSLDSDALDWPILLSGHGSKVLRHRLQVPEKKTQRPSITSSDLGAGVRRPKTPLNLR